MRIQSFNLDLQSKKYRENVFITESGREVSTPYAAESATTEILPEIKLSLSKIQTEVSEFKKEVIKTTLQKISELPKREGSLEGKNSINPHITIYGENEKISTERGSILNINNGVSITNPTDRIFVRTIESLHEKLDFSAKGVVRTGTEEILIDLEFTLTRNMMSKKEVEAAFKDPLVINFDRNLANISGEKFSFDIDSDGLEDQISLLSKGSGFLALDRNGNHTIDNGKELFGADNGDGFAALEKYDEDNNNWIDANDEIFNKLRIWIKNDSGEDRLVGLGQVGIGAIFLGDIETEFKIQNSDTIVGELTDTSIFLKEDGDVGIIQNVNLNVQEGEKETGEQSFPYEKMKEEDFHLDLQQFQVTSDLISENFEKQKIEKEKTLELDSNTQDLRSAINSLENRHQQSVNADERKKLESEILILKNKITAIEGANLTL